MFYNKFAKKVLGGFFKKAKEKTKEISFKIHKLF